MNQKQWEPLTTAEAVIEAVNAGRHVEFTACGNDYDLPICREFGSRGWIKPDKIGDVDDVAWTLARAGNRYRALIAPAQPAADVDPADAELADVISKGTDAWSGVPEGWVDELRGEKPKPMNIIEEAKRLLHSEDHRGLHPEIHAFIRAVAGLEPIGYLHNEFMNRPINCMDAFLWEARGMHTAPLYILEPTND